MHAFTFLFVFPADEKIQHTPRMCPSKPVNLENSPEDMPEDYFHNYSKCPQVFPDIGKDLET